MTPPGWIGAKVALKGVWLAAIAAVLLCALACTAVQTVRLQGFRLWPISTEGWIAKAGRFERERDAERRSHVRTKTDYRNAQIEAARLERQRLERVQAKQQEITDAVRNDYTIRLADARARADRLRRELQARSAAGGASAGGAVSGIPVATGGAPAAAADDGLPDAALAAAERIERELVATEQALQLDALIDWVERQAAIDPNAGETRQDD